MEQWLLDQGTRFGYLIVLVGVGIESMGVPVPGETALLVGGVLAGTGRLSWAGVWLAAWTGAVAGDNAGYWFGRRWRERLLGLPLLRHVYSPERLAAAERLIARRGIWAVFLGRFVALLRIFAGPIAGMHRMPWRRFVIANASGALLWVSAVLLIGYLLGSNLDHAVRLLSTTGWVGLALFLLLVITALVVHHRHSQRLS